ncbi:hypothetical protein [Actinoallomurus sp. NPDC050550]|uniref:hypothetical protein n=1 Tax=Actinoallomurus sp. NPDC050550 TaxID=3154937 RepID=UPI00340D7B8C
MSGKLALAAGQVAQTATAHALLRGGVDERTGEALTARVVAERVGWAADLVAGMTTDLLAEHWNAGDVSVLAGGADGAGRVLPSNGWMALRRLGWGVRVLDGVRVNDRIVRMAQEQAGRTLRGAQHRAQMVAGILNTWPADSDKRTPAEWDAVREAIPDGRSRPSGVIRARTRQVTAFVARHGRFPVDVFELEEVPRAARMWACTRSAQPPPTAGTSHGTGPKERHWAQASTCTPTPPHPGGQIPQSQHSNVTTGP